MFGLTGHEEKGMPRDFNDPTQRKKAEAMIDLQEPHLLIGSPMCTAFSHIQNLNNARRDPIIVEQELVTLPQADQQMSRFLSQAPSYGNTVAREALFGSS